MYQNIFISWTGAKPLIHLWDDQKGHTMLPFKKYAYEKNRSGTLRSLYGDKLKKIKYWKKEGRTAWILKEIGKTEPITFGIVIKDNKIEKIKVLEFRESRGWEVKYPAFTKQFYGAGLESDKLTKRIDGISGATLSLWAMTGVSRMALYLHQHLSNKPK